ncbi:MAG: aminotransferase class III-fold pyridoxal phosphate-dependent enzyme [Pseudomonadota bacterium]
MDWKSQNLIARHKKVFPGPHTNLAFTVDEPKFFYQGKGSHIWDTDGNEYIDYMISMGAGVLGYGHPEFLSAMHQQLDQFYYYTGGTSQHPWEVELGEKISKYVPCAEQLRFGMTGSEACQLAFRLARAYTKRPYILHFEGHYHGWLDNVQGASAHEDPVEMPFARIDPDSRYETEGRDPSALANYFRIPWNDAAILEKVLERWGQQIACVIMEPVCCSSGALPPRPGYLNKARELCNKYGIVLCFDEVQTGFRLGLGGAQAEYGVTPDLATFGKALGGGIPISMVAGKIEIMELLRQRRVVAAGTFNGYPMGVAAALATLKIMEKDDGAYFKKIEKTQNRLTEGLREISDRHGVPALIMGPRGMFAVHFTDLKEIWTAKELATTDKQKQKRFRSLLAEEGALILWNGRFYLSIAVTDKDVDRTLEMVDRAMARL